jgi:hypothetical protein
MFIGREAELTKLHQFFFSNKTGKRVLSLTGMGGCGKSQIATHFTHHHVLTGTKFDPNMVFFIDATTKATLDSSFIAISKAKGIGNTPLQARDWISNLSEPSFLLVDNADDPGINLYDYVPSSTRCHILITSRLQDSGYNYGGGLESSINLDALSREEAEDLLVRMAGIPKLQSEAVDALLKVGFP